MKAFRLEISLSLMALVASTPALAHAQLDHTIPAIEGVVRKSPGQVTLYFTEKLETKFSGIKVLNAAGERVDAEGEASGNLLHATCKEMAPGEYTVIWQAMSADAHMTRGRFNFQVSN
jgi:copper resistance protein C